MSVSEADKLASEADKLASEKAKLVKETIKSWRKRAEIDYFSLFVPLWLAFETWFKYKYSKTNGRENLESLKIDDTNNKTYLKMEDLLKSDNSNGETFRDYLTQLNESLKAINILYDHYKRDDKNKRYLSFENGLVKREGSHKDYTYENLMRGKGQHNKIELIKGVFIKDETLKFYKAYIEILYQVRCKLFHGELKPNRENERVVKYLYLTLKAITEEI